MAPGGRIGTRSPLRQYYCATYFRVKELSGRRNSVNLGGTCRNILLSLFGRDRSFFYFILSLSSFHRISLQKASANYGISVFRACTKFEALGHREILKYSSDPTVIPLSAGNPAPDAFPYDAISSLSAELLQNAPSRRCNTA